MPRRSRSAAPPPVAATPMPRRRFLATAAAVGAGTLPLLSRRGRADDVVRFGLTPVFLTSDLELLENLKAYLEARLARPVVLVQRRTYEEITALLLSEQLDAAWICGFPYIVYRDQRSLLAVPIWRGRPLYQGYLLAEATSDAIRDLLTDEQREIFDSLKRLLPGHRPH